MPSFNVILLYRAALKTSIIPPSTWLTALSWMKSRRLIAVILEWTGIGGAVQQRAYRVSFIMEYSQSHGAIHELPPSRQGRHPGQRTVVWFLGYAPYPGGCQGDGRNDGGGLRCRRQFLR